MAGAFAERRTRRLVADSKVRRVYLERGGAHSFLDAVGATPWVALSDYTAVLDAAETTLGGTALRKTARELMGEEIERGRFSPLGPLMQRGGEPRAIFGRVAPLLWDSALRHAGSLRVASTPRGVDMLLDGVAAPFLESPGLRQMFAGTILGLLDRLGLKARLRLVDQPEAERLVVRLEWTDQPATEVGMRRPTRDSTPPPDVGLHAGDALAGRYRLTHAIGAGGFGQVWRATDAKLGREVAVKVLHGHVAEQAWELLEKEARVLAGVRHPNIVTLYEVERSGGRWPFLVLELLPGVSLTEQVLREGPVPPGLACKVVGLLLNGLEAAHEAGVLHRDVTPHNVLLSRSGGSGRSVKLIDFGLAGRVDDDDARVGTLSYMAPEQLQGAEPTVRSDLYSVGATLYHALTGRPPYALQEHEDKRAFFAAVAKGPLPSLEGLPAPLVPVLRKALAKDPAARFGSCAEMRAACDEARRALREDD